MATLSDLIARTRLELADLAKTFVHTTTSVGATVTYDIPRVEQVDSGALVVRKNGAVIPAEDYVLDAAAGVVTFTGSLPADGDTIQISGSHHKFFSDDVMTTFVESAFALHTTNRTITMAALPSNEVYLVALLAKVEALWVLATDAAYDIDVRTPEGVSVPRTQRYAQLISMAKEAENQYKDLSMALGVGLHRVEMFTLRRTSYMTGRLVPVYVPREFDDPKPPQRVFPPIDEQFAPIPIPTVQEVSLQVYRGEPFSQPLQLLDEVSGDPLDISGYTIKASIFRSENSTQVMKAFKVTIVDAPSGQVTLSLTGDDTADLLPNSSYAWLIKTFDLDDVPDTPAKGALLVEGDQSVRQGVF